MASDTNSCAGSTPTCSDIYVHDRVTGETTVVSVPVSNSNSGANVSLSPAISGDGRYIVFTSLATNLVNDGRVGTLQDIYLRDRTAGTTTRVSVPAGSAPANDIVSMPSISRDGQLIMFVSKATNIDPSPDPIADAGSVLGCRRIYAADENSLAANNRSQRNLSVPSGAHGSSKAG